MNVNSSLAPALETVGGTRVFLASDFEVLALTSRPTSKSEIT